MSVGDAIMIEAALTYLGLGLPPECRGLGHGPGHGQEVPALRPMVADHLPGYVMISILAMGFTMLGEGWPRSEPPPAGALGGKKTFLKSENLHVHFPIHIGTVRAVEDVSLNLRKGEVMGLVGESGCGKSTLGFSILRLLRPRGASPAAKSSITAGTSAPCPKVSCWPSGHKISMIFQDPLTSLNPLVHHRRPVCRDHPDPRAQGPSARTPGAGRGMLLNLGISPDRLHEYPHQMSGGMRQRIMIGIGLILDPDLLIADEPTTALDVIVEAQFLDLLNELRKNST
jgi:peptide/nickel transport system ATP-binding protein